MAAKQVLLTSDGLKKLQDELENLKTVRRQENKEAIKRARSFGDLSENSEYDEAKEEQANIERRISEIEGMLVNVKIIDEDLADTDTVTVGSTVKIKCLDDGEEEIYAIVGSTESNPLEGKISDECPVGKALLNHKVGETVTVEIPDGVTNYEILAIER
ncbi:MAG: transcription elongation factor GreA [Oscillospiraceae bacterium]|nr:transcription elongation factor GreA [Oscillospiraceae bacterium]